MVLIIHRPFGSQYRAGLGGNIAARYIPRSPALTRPELWVWGKPIEKPDPGFEVVKS